MRLSTRTRYGCRALAEVAAAYPAGTPSVREIARKQRLSSKYLESIMQALKVAGLVRATRGMHGGYALTHPPSEVKLSDVFRVLEGPSAPVPCVDTPDLCAMSHDCPTRGTWVELKAAIDGVLNRRTLQDLAARCGAGPDAVPPAL
jgi:Rrf2 family cysteine metabolism transcriptional repressor